MIKFKHLYFIYNSLTLLNPALCLILCITSRKIMCIFIQCFNTTCFLIPSKYKHSLILLHGINYFTMLKLINSVYMQLYSGPDIIGELCVSKIKFWAISLTCVTVFHLQFFYSFHIFLRNVCTSCIQHHFSISILWKILCILNKY